MLTLYSFALTAAAALYAVLTVLFTRAVGKRIGGECDSGDLGVSYLRGAARLMFSDGVPLDRSARNFRLLLRILGVIIVIGFYGALYIDATEATRPGECELCQLDPRGRDVGFWLRYAFPVLVLQSMSLIEVLLARIDTRPGDSGDLFDRGRVQIGWNTLFQERMNGADRVTLWICWATRCSILLCAFNALALLAGWLWF